jgi:hypothetical protein
MGGQCFTLRRQVRLDIPHWINSTPFD